MLTTTLRHRDDRIAEHRDAAGTSAAYGINSARTSGQLRADFHVGEVPTTANNDTLWQTSPLSSKTVFIDWAGSKYPDLASFRKATGQELNGTQANGC